MNTTFKLTLIALATAGLAMQATAQVKSFDKPPTLEELRKSLAAPAAPAAPAVAEGSTAPRARGIVWNQAPAKADGASGGSPSAQTLAQEAAAPAAAAPTQSAGVALPITFEPGSSRLVGRSMQFIEPIAMLMKADPSIRMVVEGHTDASGSAQRNLMLSWDRAMTVFKVLVENYGIEPQRLQPLGKGSAELMDTANPEAATNRRVQFRPLG